MARNSSSSKIELDYDPDGDVLYLSIGKPVPANTKPIGGIYYRFAYDGDRPCGATIVHYFGNGWNNDQTTLAKSLSDHLGLETATLESELEQFRYPNLN